jgi:hypothetical protein
MREIVDEREGELMVYILYLSDEAIRRKR